MISLRNKGVGQSSDEIAMLLLCVFCVRVGEKDCLPAYLSVCLCPLFQLFDNRTDFCESLFDHYFITEHPICLCLFAQLLMTVRSTLKL